MAASKKTRLLLCSTRSRHVTTPEGLDVHVLSSVSLRDGDPWSWKLLPHLRWCDIVHCHQFEQLGAAFFIALARLLGKKVFVTGLGAYQDRGFWHDRDIFQLVHGFLLISRFSTEVTLPSKYWGRATVVGAGHDPSVFFPPEGGADRKGVLFVGRLLPHKGIDVLVRAMPAEIPLRIVGPNGEKSTYMDFLEREAKGKSVSFVGFLKQARQLADEYRQASVCVLPSVYEDCFGNRHPRSEFFGLTLAEAQACGTPVICTGVGGMPEVIRDGETGFIVRERSVDDLRQALLRLLSDKELWNRFSTAATAFAEKELVWSRVADRCLEAYEKGLK